MNRTSPESFNIGNRKNPLVNSNGFNNKSQIEEEEDDFYSTRKNNFNRTQKDIIDEEEQKFLTYLKFLIKCVYSTLLINTEVLFISCIFFLSSLFLIKALFLKGIGVNLILSNSKLFNKFYVKFFLYILTVTF